MPAAVPLAAMQVLDAGAFELGLLGTFGMLPFLVVSLIVGVWVDQIFRRPVLIAADVLRAGLLITIPAAGQGRWRRFADSKPTGSSVRELAKQATLRIQSEKVLNQQRQLHRKLARAWNKGQPLFD